MKPEEKARVNIDYLLNQAGWDVQNTSECNLNSNLGVTVREYYLKTGYADYLLFINGRAVGVIEAKPEGTTLSGVVEQSGRYSERIPNDVPCVQKPLPFIYESTGVETYFKDLRDPEPRSRTVFAFHKPETLNEWLNQDDTLRYRLKKLSEDHPVNPKGLRDCQYEAITNLENSLADARPKSLIQMATGSGKTYTAVSFVYRLIKYAKAKRVLFLVDRYNLGKQTHGEFIQYITPDDGRKFTELYNVQHLTTNTLDSVSKVCITTIQRLYSMLKGESEYDSEKEEVSVFDLDENDEPKDVTYNPEIPIETFDFIITDECHRSIYNKWSQVLEYFDAFIIGLTATPSKQTMAFFDQNLIMEYGHERAIADGVNVGYDVYRIKTEITENGKKIEAGYGVDKRDKLTRRTRWQELDEDFEYKPGQLDRDVMNPNQIRTIIRTFKENLPEIFPGRSEVPKTLVFAKNDTHAEDITKIIKEEFGKGDEFCKKITYRTTGVKPEDLIASFRNSYNPRIAVTVDMISTGTDVKPLECVLFMRDVKSRVYFEQMKGRGTRTISSTDLQAVTPDTTNKTHFVLVDAIGVSESDKTDSRPLEKKRTVPFEKLLKDVANNTQRDPESLTSLGNRLARIDRKIDDNNRSEVEEMTGGISIKQLANSLFDAVDSDVHVEKAKEMYDIDNPTDEQVKDAYEKLVRKACEPFEDENLRNLLVYLHDKGEQIIDKVNPDKVIEVGFDTVMAEKTVTSFKQFIEDNKDEITALQIIYNKPYHQRPLTYEEIRKLSDAIKKPPYYLTPEEVWMAYERLEQSKVKGAGPQRLLTDIVSLLRFTLGESSVLEPFSNVVEQRFNEWLTEQKRAGKTFTQEQERWLDMIKNHIATSLNIDLDDFDNVPFNQEGGAMRAYELFGDKLYTIINELNTTLAEA